MREHAAVSPTQVPEPPAPQAAPAGPVAAMSPAQVLALQRTAGNAAVVKLLRAPAAQEQLRVVERMPTIPEPGVRYVVAQPEKRYDFEVAIYDKPMRFRALTPAQTVEKLRVVWRLVHQELDAGRAENLKLVERREEHSVAGFWSDLFGDVEVPDPDMWNEVGRGPLAAVRTVLDSTDAALQAQWAPNAQAAEHFREIGLEHNPYVQAALAFDATQERIAQAVALLERAAADLNERHRRLDEYVEGSNRGAQRAISGIKVTIVVLAAAAGGAGAGFAGEGAGLLAQAGASAGTTGLLGAADELFTQAGEMRIGEREHFDFARIAKRGVKDSVTAFVGGVVGGRFAGAIKNQVGGWVGGLSNETLAAYGIAREELLTNGEKLFIEWVGGNLAASPFTTAASAVMDRALEGRWKVSTYGDFTALVFDDMVKNGTLGGFLHFAGHGLGPRAGAEPPAPAAEPAPAPAPAVPAAEPAAPAEPGAPVIEESPPGGFEPTTQEPPPDDYGPEPEVVDIDLEEIGPVDESDLDPPPRAAGAPPSAARPRSEESFAGSRRRGIKRARPYNARPPGGAGGARPATPRRETRTLPDPERRFHGSAAEVRTAAAAKLKALHDKMVQARRAAGGTPEIERLIAEIRTRDPAFADKVRLYYDKVEDPQFLEDAMADLWEQAARHNRTVAEELEHVLGRPVNEFRNVAVGRDAAVKEFQAVVQDPRTLVDLSFAHDTHGSHTHAFHQYLGDRVFGPGEGLRFRQDLARLNGPGRRVAGTQWDQPFWSQLWDELFDASGDSLHTPERLGEILQQVLDFPRFDP